MKTGYPLMASRASRLVERFKNEPAVPKEEQAPLETAEQNWPLEERIRQRAYQLYRDSGEQHGSDLDHWLQAEAEIRGKEPKG
jgi:hypothetical protein